MIGFLYLFGAIALHMIEKKRNIIKRFLRSSNYSISKKNKKIGIIEKANTWLKKNNINLDIREFIIIIFTISLLPLIFGLLLRVGIFISILLSIIAVFLTFIFIDLKSRKENAKKENQLGQFLLDLVGNLYGNPNILVSLEKTLGDAEYPLAREFEIVLGDTKRGLLLNQALRNMINRNKSLVIEVVLIGFIAANDKGVSLIEFLKDQIEYIRERKNIENYIKVLSSGPKYTSYIIMFIPLVSIIIIALINKNFVEILFSRIGLLFLTYAVVSYGIGFFLINRIVNFSERSRVLK